ncbi:putative Glycogen synthase kinase-3 beta [Blattamonas nauphoetae]|uniref:Glycogen synthase kinase-3 beta n=1 Tax=Blattamonas nauphoetae TaxID=2049346 RepID=A0ABQ9XNB9_9EUKA|nr:putative Glycogen synthase kinase-3 beta [Blattamonas nauphoetae]
MNLYQGSTKGVTNFISDDRPNHQLSNGHHSSSPHQDNPMPNPCQPIALRLDIKALSDALADGDEELLPQFDTTPISFSNDKSIGSGSFGTVFHATLPSNGEAVAVKKVLQDPNYKNRELLMMRVIDHPNCVKMRQYFYSKERQKTYLNVVMEYVPHTLYHINKHYVRQKREMPTAWVKIYSYQLIRSLLYLNGFGIAHRDIKPQNILVNPRTGVLKLCDFGSAKVLRPGESSVAYICSRYYRAPELVFGTQKYTTSVDTWSVGAVIAELLLGRPIFPGDSPVDQLVRIISILGTPTREDMAAMDQADTPINFPHTRKKPWTQVFPSSSSRTAIDLVARMLVYDPSKRITPLQALNHPLFDELRDDENTRFPDGTLFPPFFNFTPDEMEITNAGIEKIWEKHQSRFPKPCRQPPHSSTGDLSPLAPSKSLPQPSPKAKDDEPRPAHYRPPHTLNLRIEASSDWTLPPLSGKDGSTTRPFTNSSNTHTRTDAPNRTATTASSEHTRHKPPTSQEQCFLPYLARDQGRSEGGTIPHDTPLSLHRYGSLLGQPHATLSKAKKTQK